jgi:hypothetical protein
MKRNDAEKVRDLDALHRIIPYLMKRRTDSVVYYTIQVDIENAMRYLREKNEGKHKRYYSYFVLILAALLRTIALRPHLNRFIANNTFYQRKDISFTFIVKKELSDEGDERNAFLVFKPDDTLEDVAERVNTFIDECRTAEKVGQDKTLDILLRFPKFTYARSSHSSGFSIGMAGCPKNWPRKTASTLRSSSPTWGASA